MYYPNYKSEIDKCKISGFGDIKKAGEWIANKEIVGRNIYKGCFCLAEEKGKSKIGWVGLTLISTIVVVLTASSIFFFSLFPFDVQSFFTSDKQTTEEEDNSTASEETIEDVEQVQESVDKEHQDIGKFVSSMHDFYNETTGYGGIDDLDWDKQIEQAEHIEATLEEKISGVKNQALKNDFANVQDLAN